MNKKTIRLIIVLMSLAMLGLIAFQGYWINNAIRINEERFKKDVHDALNNVVNRLEKQEVLFVASNKLQAINKNNGKQLIELDTIKFFNRKGANSIINTATLSSNFCLHLHWSLISTAKLSRSLMILKLCTGMMISIRSAIVRSKWR